MVVVMKVYSAPTAVVMPRQMLSFSFSAGASANKLSLDDLRMLFGLNQPVPQHPQYQYPTIQRYQQQYAGASGTGGGYSVVEAAPVSQAARAPVSQAARAPFRPPTFVPR